ncbi:DNA cytosine methyltransferase [Aeromonas caviae]|uniref:DNA cytosine methyltransferase n=1 Tax=Aeromonas caviae TaxID=648 RepID=UPI00311DE7EC
MNYGSVCSGIEAASLAWEPLGWNPAWFAEIEPFPSAVLAHHWPHVTNLGDMTKIATAVLKGDVVAPDILVGGTPCQAFSVAGAREGLADDRGFLTIKYVELANAIDQKRAAAGVVPCITVWENVPGVLSSKDNAFGAFLGFLAGEDCELVPPGKKWENAGCVLGPQRAIAWRILDAQYFGVAQRRRRVFVVASARKGFDPTEILFEREGVRRDTPPSREAGQEAAGNAGGGFKVGSHWDGDGYAHPTLSQSHNTGGIGASNQELFSQRGAGLVPTSRGADDNQAQAGHLIQHVAGTLQANGKAAGSATQQDAESGMLVVHGTQDPDTNVELAHTLGRNQGQENAVLTKYNSIKDHDQRVIFAANNWDELVRENPPCVTGDITHTLKAEGFDASEDGTGRGQPIVPVAFQPGNLSRGAGASPSTEVFPTLKANHGRGASDQDPHVAYPMPQAGVQHGVAAFAENSRQEVRLEGGDGQITGALSSGGGKVGQGYSAAMIGMAVRRLTPVECERLQDFPDNHTLIPVAKRNKLIADELAYLLTHFPDMSEEEAHRQAADGPRYKALGNSMAVPCMAFIGQRIDLHLSEIDLPDVDEEAA